MTEEIDERIIEIYLTNFSDDTRYDLHTISRKHINFDMIHGLLVNQTVGMGYYGRDPEDDREKRIEEEMVHKAEILGLLDNPPTEKQILAIIGAGHEEEMLDMIKNMPDVTYSFKVSQPRKIYKQ